MSPANQAVQSAHSLADAIFKFRKEALTWHRESNTLVLLDVADQGELFMTLTQLKDTDIKFCPFYEPDFGGELTAICLIPTEDTAESVKDFTKRFKLARLVPVAQQGERPALNWKGERASRSGDAEPLNWA